MFILFVSSLSVSPSHSFWRVTDFSYFTCNYNIFNRKVYPLIFVITAIGLNSVIFILLLLLLFSCSVMSNSLRLYELQQARLLCPSPSPRACSDSCPLSQWCHPTISSSVIPFSSCLLSFPGSGSDLQWVGSSYQVVKVLELQLQHQSFWWIFRVDTL